MEELNAYQVLALVATTIAFICMAVNAVTNN